uniref:Cadherin domain-containing protein n=1 Tax=Steinernema glaseri TaxID=37863 RepID=A0A1I7Y081_9BILA
MLLFMMQILQWRFHAKNLFSSPFQLNFVVVFNTVRVLLSDMADSQTAVAPNGNATSNGSGPSVPSKHHHHSIFSRLISRGDLRITVQLLDDNDTVTHEFKLTAVMTGIRDDVNGQS